MVGVSTLVHAGAAGEKNLLGGRSKGRRRRWWNFTCCLLWESNGEGGADEFAAGGIRRVIC